jgi:hypothetical protein
LRGYPPCLFREVIAIKTYHILGVGLDRIEILSDVLNNKFILKETSYTLGICEKNRLKFARTRGPDSHAIEMKRNFLMS